MKCSGERVHINDKDLTGTGTVDGGRKEGMNSFVVRSRCEDTGGRDDKRKVGRDREEAGDEIREERGHYRWWDGEKS